MDEQPEQARRFIVKGVITQEWSIEVEAVSSFWAIKEAMLCVRAGRVGLNEAEATITEVTENPE